MFEPLQHSPTTRGSVWEGIELFLGSEALLESWGVTMDLEAS